ncbi:MAG: hypothetical protein R3F13_17435 [Prosthecobacter sp.]
MRGAVIRALLLVLSTVASARAQKVLMNDEVDLATGTRVQVRSVFDPPPSTGYAPMRVVATNGTGRNARWRFDFHAQTQQFRQPNQHNSAFPLDVPARSTQSALFLVPLTAGYGDSGSGNQSYSLRVSLSGTGFGDRQQNQYHGRTSRFPHLALSETLAESGMTQLNKELETQLKAGGGYFGGSAVFGSRFEPAELPESWLGFSGYDFILLSSTDWLKLKPGARRALQEWVRLGGHLDIYDQAGAAASVAGMRVGANSLGEVRTLKWDGKKLPAKETVTRYWGKTSRVKGLVSDHSTASDWPLLGLLGTRSFASWQVILFLVVFGVLVGPVNLFVLAPAGKRHKLFVTTPLLSIGASIVMVVLILFQDGTGGVGRRFVAIDVEPSEAAAYVTQEQVSRTGVLMGAGFELKQPALIEPLALPDTPWVKLKSTRLGQAVNLTQEGTGRTGNFFQSRAEQGQVLRAAVSTRARIELKTGTAPDAPPTLISALGFTVDELHYVDAAGREWRLEAPLVTGRSATLVASDASARRMRSEAMFNPAVKSLRAQLTRATNNQRSFFIAKAAGAPGFMLETLPSIRWEDDCVVVFGPVLQP